MKMTMGSSYYCLLKSLVNIRHFTRVIFCFPLHFSFLDKALVKQNSKIRQRKEGLIFHPHRRELWILQNSATLVAESNQSASPTTLLNPGRTRDKEFAFCVNRDLNRFAFVKDTKALLRPPPFFSPAVEDDEQH
mmetsp:Transcript_7252/g.14321  ORF Transcript_7252/g.14321 Transcript_7252/m.14321 type:complete len:134 (+) Transcript_7252:104-505(+)